VDETVEKRRLATERADARRVAVALARLKAAAVACRYPDHLVLGCDQVLACEGRLFDKAASLDEARQILKALRGRKHELITASVLMRGEEILWEHVAVPCLWMRAFSDAFLERYLVDEAEHILSAVGCYRVEGRGVQLFAEIEGDQFAIRGAPLVPLLEALRAHGVIAQ
jgi:septum formation protein